MTDELVYERLAISIARSGSPLPRVHGVSVTSLDQLYPLLIAPLFRDGAVTTDLHQRTHPRRWLMTSACIPAFLLARRVTARGWVASLHRRRLDRDPLADLLVVPAHRDVAYPVFVWAMLALQRAVASPSVRADSRRARDARADVPRPHGVHRARRRRAARDLPHGARCSLDREVAGTRKAAARRSVARHRVLAVAYAAARGRSSWSSSRPGARVASLSVYGEQIHSGCRCRRALRATSSGISRRPPSRSGSCPFVAGLAWLLANSFAPSRASLDARSFAAVGSVTVVAVTVEVARYDAGLGTVDPRPLPLLPRPGRAARVCLRRARPEVAALVAPASARPRLRRLRRSGSSRRSPGRARGSTPTPPTRSSTTPCSRCWARSRRSRRASSPRRSR